MHIASQEWPQTIVKSLLIFGADLSIRDNKKKYALKDIPESTILEVLDFHCMRSSFDLEKNGLADELITEKGSNNALYNEDNMEEEEEWEQVLRGVEQVRCLDDQAEQAGVVEVGVELATQDYSDNYLI